MWLLERDFWLIASSLTIFLNAVYYLFPPVSTLVAWRRCGVYHFKLSYFYSLPAWAWMGVIACSWYRDSEASGLYDEGERLFDLQWNLIVQTLFFGFLLSWLYCLAWQTPLMLRGLMRAYQHEMASPWRRLQRAADQRRDDASA